MDQYEAASISNLLVSYLVPVNGSNKLITDLESNKFARGQIISVECVNHGKLVLNPFDSAVIGGNEQKPRVRCFCMKMSIPCPSMVPIL